MSYAEPADAVARDVTSDISYAFGETKGGRATDPPDGELHWPVALIKRASGYEHEVAAGRDFWDVMVERYGLTLDIVAALWPYPRRRAAGFDRQPSLRHSGWPDDGAHPFDDPGRFSYSCEQCFSQGRRPEQDRPAHFLRRDKGSDPTEHRDPQGPRCAIWAMVALSAFSRWNSEHGGQAVLEAQPWIRAGAALPPGWSRNLRRRWFRSSLTATPAVCSRLPAHVLRRCAWDC